MRESRKADRGARCGGVGTGLSSARAAAGALLILAAVACGSTTTPITTDAGPSSDSSTTRDSGDRTDSGPNADAGPLPDSGPFEMPDAVAPNAMVEVSGKLVELGGYLARQGMQRTAGDGGAAPAPEGVGGAAVLALGVSPTQQTLSADQQQRLGDFSLMLPQNGITLLFAQKATYAPSYTKIKTQGANVSGLRTFIASAPYLTSIANAHGVDLTAPFACHPPPIGGLSASDRCIYGVIIGQILDDGTTGGAPRPVAGVGATEFEVVGGPQNAVWFKRGPYFLTSTGTPSRNALVSVVQQDADTLQYRGGLFAMFVEIPAVMGPQGLDFRISIAHPMAPATRYFGPTTVKAFRPYGVSWIQVPETGTPPPMDYRNVDFDSQVYPLFLSVTQGGLGCQGCHIAPTPAGAMNLGGGPAMAFAQLDPVARPDGRRVNLADPAASLVLTNPLFNPSIPQTHPIIAFTSTQDPGYRTILTWIQEGAHRNTGMMRVSFNADVRPIIAQTSTAGGAGCAAAACHGTRPGQANFYVRGTPQELYTALTTQMATDRRTGQMYRIDKNPGDSDKSLVLVKPLMGNPATHPVKLFSSNVDPRYVTIYRWIAQGYLQN